jgi:hypothetical protein
MKSISSTSAFCRDSSVSTFVHNQYTITTSLNDRAIYIKIINNLSYMCYEGNFDNASFKLPFDIREIYAFTCKCFSDPNSEPENNEYSVDMQLDNGTLLLQFEGIVGGFLTVQFDLRLREKLMSNDAQLTINFQRVEQKQQQAFEELVKRMVEMERRLEALGHAEICFTEPPSNSRCIKSYPIDLKTLTITDESNDINSNSFKKIQHFYQLEELTMNNCQWCEPNKYSSNATVTKLKITNCPSFRDISFIQNFPSLVELSMSGTPMDGSIVTTLRSIKHKIKKLTFKNCQGINQTEMQTYCTQTGITLSLS